MTQIKDHFKKAPNSTVQEGTEYYALTKQLTGVGITTDITEKHTELRHRQSSTNTCVELKVGDIVFNTRAPKECKIINSLPKQYPVYAGSNYFVLRPLKNLPADIKPLPTWAIVITARQVGNLWLGGSMGTLFGGQAVLAHKFEVIPDENPKGIQLLDHAEKLLELKAQAIKTMEEFHHAVAYRMLKNLPLRKGTVPDVTPGATATPAKAETTTAPETIQA